MTDSSHAETTQTSSEEEAHNYVEQLREAPADQVLTEILLGVVNAAQVKLGRPDARVFIDLTATMIDTARAHVDQQLATTIDQTVAQMRIAQVEAEGKPAGDG
jgi:hypothetical protein